jgi:hypothetical protein
MQRFSFALRTNKNNDTHSDSPCRDEWETYIYIYI